MMFIQKHAALKTKEKTACLCIELSAKEWPHFVLRLKTASQDWISDYIKPKLEIF